MLDATKYMNRLRVIVAGVDELVYMNKSEQLDYLLNRVKDVVKDYDKDFDNAMEEMETKEMFNMKRGDPYAEGTG
tara:strand:- start:151 stop:375 length:225 start_codon:yes stop_codon:yes gene_type:complete